MKSSIAAMTLACTLAAPTVFAQGTNAGAPSGGTRRFSPPRLPFARTPSADSKAARDKSAPTDPKVFQTRDLLPAPTPPDQIAAPTIALPNDPIEPYLLTKDAGPFMVSARSFVGPECDRYALALVLELRKDYGLPAYILRSKDFPGLSNIRNVPPTAPQGIRQPNLSPPERYRTYDEAVVLVGDEKTLDDSEALLHKVKKIRPKCLNGMPSLLPWRQDSGLSRALRTTNPYVPAQNLFPRKSNTLLKQMNAGPRSVYQCPGRYTLQVADFTGRSTFDPEDQRFQGMSSLKKSPLVTAASDAEKLANALAKDKDIQRTGYQPYVYHDLTSSKVMIGSFNAPDDPSAARLRETLLRLAVPLANRKVTDSMIVPAVTLTDLQTVIPR